MRIRMAPKAGCHIRAAVHRTSLLIGGLLADMSGIGGSQEVAAAEAKKASLQLRVDVVSQEREKLGKQLASLQGGVSEAEAELTQAQEAIAVIKDQVCVCV